MKRHIALLVSGLALGLVSQAGAGDFWQGLLNGTACWPDCVGKYCCDDYVAKCPPYPRPVCCFQCNDYCRKCPPLSKPVNCFTSNDYCRKLFRFWCPPNQDRKCLPDPCSSQPSAPTAQP